MSQEIKLVRVNECLWEIPPVGRMNVPGRIYADESLIPILREDQAPQQVANVACLPGIVKYSLAMPDIHWGYGFPIGGVAAFDLETGIVSPGGIGFDINCLSGETQVVSSEGYHRTISEIVEEEISGGVRVLDRRARRMTRAQVRGGLRKRADRPVREVLTRGGHRVVATIDHPFLTPRGMRALERLAVGDRVAVSGFTGVPYEEPSGRVLVDEAAIEAAWRRLCPRSARTSWEQIRARLVTQDLLPLRDDHEAMPSLLKLIGLLWGDGTLYVEGESGRARMAVNGLREDLESLRRDLAPWVRTSRVHSRVRSHYIATRPSARPFTAREQWIRIGSSSLAVLLVALGVPSGPKASSDWGIPTWLPTAPSWHKRLFLAAFFGAEMTSPATMTGHDKTFPEPSLTVVKREGHVRSGIKFLGQVASLLSDLGVRAKVLHPTLEVRRANGSDSHRVRLQVACDTENLLALWESVGFEYNRKRAYLASIAAGYLRAKRAAIARRDALRERVLELRAQTRVGSKTLLLAIGGPEAGVNIRFVDHTIYGRGDRILRAAEAFPTFAEWRTTATRGLGRSGLFWDEVASVSTVPQLEHVYDLTVAHRGHNFVANGFLVHNCGIRLLRTNLVRDQVKGRVHAIIDGLFETIPSGVGSKGAIPKLSTDEARDMLRRGAVWAVEKGYGAKTDLPFIEDEGSYPTADPGVVSDKAIQRGLVQIGTLGSGNHFLEMDLVAEVLDPTLAQHFGLKEDGVAFFIHTGSRGFGYQVCQEYSREFISVAKKYGIDLMDRQLACAPLPSPEAKAYLGAMGCAANFAWVNRQVIMALVEQSLMRTLGLSKEALGLGLVYDVCHNIAKFEEHEVDGVRRKLCVHRKGATRALPAGHPLVPQPYAGTGQPVLIPGDMGRASYLCVGLPGSLVTFNSTCHGAGRVASRGEMMRKAKGRNLRRELEQQGVYVRAQSFAGLAEEMPDAYKDVGAVVECMETAGVSRRVARFRPIGCVKG